MYLNPCKYVRGLKRSVQLVLSVLTRLEIKLYNAIGRMLFLTPTSMDHEFKSQTGQYINEL